MDAQHADSLIPDGHIEFWIGTEEPPAPWVRVWDQDVLPSGRYYVKDSTPDRRWVAEIRQRFGATPPPPPQPMYDYTR